MKESGQLHAPAALPRIKDFRVVTEYEAGWAPEPVLRLEKNVKSSNSSSSFNP
jgi:hypothetical protein